MAIIQIRCVALCVLLLLATSVSPARAVPNPRCGTGLVAGVAGCASWMMKLSEYRDLMSRARRGDNEAAVKLAQFEDTRDDRTAEGGRRWWLLAAERGECQALRTMRDDEARTGNRAAAAKWRTRILSNKCAPAVRGERWLGF